MNIHFKKSYIWLIAVFLVGICCAFAFDYFVVQPSRPYMLLDKEAPMQNSPIKYFPVEVTGKPVEEGVRTIVCNVPKELEQYVHNKPEGEWNIMNPEGKAGKIIKQIAWPLVALLAIGVTAYGIWTVKKIKARHEKDDKKSH